ncbi:BBP7 family outer membrane beta-barrel protein [Thermostilla marina]
MFRSGLYGIGIVLSGAALAWGQYGLTGAPELMAFPQSYSAAQAPQDAYAAPGSYGSQPASRSQASPYSQFPAPSAAFNGVPRPQYASQVVPQPAYYPAGPVAPAAMPYAAPQQSRPAMPPSGGLIPAAATQPVPIDQGEAPLLLEAQPPATSSSDQVNLMDRMLGNQEGETLEAPVMPDGVEPADDDWSFFGTEACPTCGSPCGETCLPPVLWYVDVGGLIMGRNDANRVWFSYQSNNNANQIMHSQDARTGWQGGWEITLGRYLGGPAGSCGLLGDCNPCARWAIEATYWGIADMEGDSSVTHASYVSTPLIFTDVVYADPSIVDPVTDLFFGVYEQKLERRNDFHSVELNLVRRRMADMPHGLGVDWLCGVRYFRFDEELLFGSKAHNGAWGASPTEEGFLSDRTENNLVGVQFGFDMRYYLGYNLSLSCVPKIGIYGNHIRNRFKAYRGDGEVFGPDPTPPLGDPVSGSYPVSSTDDALSFLTQIDLGVDWQMTPRWSAFVGYRVVVATGIALADNQFPPYVVDIPEIADIDTNGELVLHGGVAGLTYTW